MKDRRQKKRLAIKVPIIWNPRGCKGENVTDGFLIDAQNVTTTGLFLRTDMHPKKGSRVRLKLDINKKTKPIELNGRVVWIARKKKYSYQYPGVGIKFEHGSRDEHKRLGIFVKNKLGNFHDANELKNMYKGLKDMASRLVELEERHPTAAHFKKAIYYAIGKIDNVAHILDREINEIKKM